jgi:DNA-binding MarR family transcriptional regulator
MTSVRPPRDGGMRGDAMGRDYSRTEAGAALMRVIAATLQASFKLRALGRRTGFVSARGGVWGLLRSLKDGGPQTVPALARARPVSRQHIQMLADSMAADGLVAYKANPAHRRSHLVAIAPKGERLLEDLTKRLAAISDDLAAGMDAKKLAASAELLAMLSAKLDAALGDYGEEPVTPRRRTRSPKS